MTKDTVIKTVNFNRNAVTTSTLTGYTSIVDASVLNGKNAIVVADANGVISSITIYSATAPVVAASYAVYAGLGELDGVKGQYYNFYVNGEIVSFLANDTTVASAITGLTAPKVATYVAAGEKITTITDKGAGAAATVTILADGYIVNGSTVIYTAPNMVVVDGTATGNYAVTSLAKGDTITYYAGAAGIEFAIVTAHAA